MIIEAVCARRVALITFQIPSLLEQYSIDLMASSSSQYKEYSCYTYQRGQCQYGKHCRNRHDEQCMISPAERYTTPSAKAKFGATALQTGNQWQEAEPLPCVWNDKGVKYHVHLDPF